MSAAETQLAPAARKRLVDGMLVRAFLENIPEYVYFKDRESRFLAVSASLVRYYGVGSPLDLIGRTDLEIGSLDNAGAFLADEQRIIRTGEGFVGRPEKTTWADGRVTWCLTTKLPLRNAAGAIVGTFGISKDITQEKELEQSIARAHRDLVDASRLAGMAEVATGVLHNVGNVLNSLNLSAAVIGGTLRESKAGSLAKAAELLRENRGRLAAYLSRDPKGRLIPDFLETLAKALMEERRHLLEEATGLARNLDHIKDIVAMQQAYASTAGVLEPLDATTLMEDALRMNAAALSRHTVEVARDYAAVPAVWAERGKVLQVLINLIRNAKYALDECSAPRRVMTLGIQPAGPDRVLFIVSDNGVGIPPENLTKIFSHGFTTRVGGHGFGLHSSALAAKELSGSLTATSQGRGTGATFTLSLPACLPAAKAD